jgi:signal transduction histidine kinase
VVQKEARYNLRLLHPFARFVRDKHGAEELARISGRIGIAPEEMERGMHWVSGEQFELALRDVRALTDNDEAFKKAAVYRQAESLGAIRFVLWATTPQAVFLKAMKTYHLVATDCVPEVLGSTRTSLEVRFQFNGGPTPGRLTCLTRQATTAALPTFWGLPAGQLKEHSCVALGDSECRYELQWFDVKRFLPPALGMGVGGTLSALVGAMHLAQSAPTFMASAFIALGGALGYIYELHRTNKENLRVGSAINEAVREMAEEEADARLELIAMTQRQRDWNRVVEEEGRERSRMAQAMVDRISDVSRARERTLRGFSHDLRNPLTVLSAGVSALRDAESALGDEGPQILEDFEHAVDQMNRLLNDLMQVATSQTMLTHLGPAETVHVSELPDRWRRRLRALSLGKDIRVTAFRAREAPDQIEVDPLVLDRVLDNILSNAAKYTERGSIVIEVAGTPGFMTVKVSDTGRGIAAEELSRTFEPGGSDAKSRAANSFGVGLSVVVQLLGQIGGKLEVMSKPSVGTTFWIHFPLVMKQPATPSERPVRESYRETLSRVLTIRKVLST